MWKHYSSLTSNILLFTCLLWPCFHVFSLPKRKDCPHSSNDSSPNSVKKVSSIEKLLGPKIQWLRGCFFLSEESRTGIMIPFSFRHFWIQRLTKLIQTSESTLQMPNTNANPLGWTSPKISWVETHEKGAFYFLENPSATRKTSSKAPMEFYHYLMKPKGPKIESKRSIFPMKSLPSSRFPHFLPSDFKDSVAL